MFTTCPFIRPFVRRLPIDTTFSKRMNRLWCKLANVIHGGSTCKRQLWGPEGHGRPKLDLEAWQKHRSRPRWIEWLFSFTYSNETGYGTWNELQRSLWRSPAMSSYPRRLDFLLRDRKSRTQLIFRQNSLNDLEGQSRSLAMAQFNSPLSLSISGR